jgi:hypothetical protein
LQQIGKLRAGFQAKMALEAARKKKEEELGKKMDAGVAQVCNLSVSSL